MSDMRAFVGEFDPAAGARLWFLNGSGRREPVEHLVDQSPHGMSWGYAGNGPADAALSMLTVAIGDRNKAAELQDEFMRDVLAKLPVNERFTLPFAQVETWLGAHGVARGRPRPPSAFDTGDAQDENLDRRAADLANRARALAERERRLVEREVRIDAMAITVGVLPDVEQVTVLPAEPVRRHLEALVVDTGDDVAVVAQANGLDPRVAAAVAAGKLTNLDLAHVRHVCEALHCTPYDLWGTAGARSVSHAYGPDAWPAHTEPLMPVDGADALYLSPSADWAPVSPALAASAAEPPAPELEHDFGPELVP